MHITTIASRNYLPRVRVLIRSFLEQVPEGRATLLLLDPDGAPDLTREPFAVVTPTQVLPDVEWARMAAMYDIVELATAVKPSLLSFLLDDSKAVHYFDPDIRFHADPRFIDDLARLHEIVLTPHLTHPSPGGATDREDLILRAGAFNLGYISVGQGARDTLLPWWRDRLARDCVIDPANERFVDQRWLDLAHGYFDVHVLRHGGCNVAYWNLAGRRVHRDDGRWMVDDEDLVFFHFSGFDPARPYVLSRYLGPNPDVRLSGEPGLRALVDAYRRELRDAGEDVRVNAPRHPMPLPGEARTAYRAALIKAEATNRPEPPNPMIHGRGTDATGTGDRGAVTDASPGATGTAAETGVTLIGYLSSPKGIGVVARGCAAALESAGEPLRRGVLDPDHPEHGCRIEDPAGPPSDITLLFANADQTPLVHPHLPAGVTEGSYVIGWWWWELEDFPAYVEGALGLVDEIWVGSAFIRDAVMRRTTKPVRVMPVPVEPGAAADGAREAAGVPAHAFMVLTACDLDSVVMRKNPIGAVNAYLRAFGPGDGCVLVVKTMNGDRHGAVMEELRLATAGRRDVRIIDRVMDPAEVTSLIAACDCFLSLHRSEGFGLMLAEAMAHGRPVIATRYSGNLEYMDDEVAFLVSARTTRVGTDAPPYPADATWAEPSVAEAVTLLRRIREEPGEARERGRAARGRIRREYSRSVCGTAMTARLTEIRSGRMRERSRTEARPGDSPLATLGTRIAASGATPWRIPGRRATSLLLRGYLRALRPYMRRRGEVDHALLDELYDVHRQIGELHAAQAETHRRVEAAEAESHRRVEAAEARAASMALELADIQWRQHNADREATIEDMAGPAAAPAARRRPAARGPVVCTVASGRRPAWADVIGRSLREASPGIPFVVLRADRGASALPSVADEVLTPGDILGKDAPAWAFRHGERELAYALTPVLLSHLLAHGYETVLFLKEETMVTGPIDGILDTAAGHAITVTPHFTEWPVDRAAALRTQAVRLAGTINGGVIGVSDRPEAHRFLEWWAGRVGADCSWDPEGGQHFEQRWLDLALGMFDDVAIVRAPGVNVGHWNLPERPIVVDGRDVTTRGVPVSIARFSGYDPDRPGLVTSYFPDGLGVDQLGDARFLFDRFRSALDSSPRDATAPYGFGRFDNGVPIPDLARRIHARLPDADRFGDPFATGPGSFAAWLDETVDGETPPVSRFWNTVRDERPDLTARFPEHLARGRIAFAQWIADHGSPELGVPPWLTRA